MASAAKVLTLPTSNRQAIREGMMEHPFGAIVGIAVYCVILLAIYIAVAIANGNLAARLDRSVPVWVILSLIPVVNVFFYIYVFYVVLFFVIDRLKLIPPAPRG